MITPNFLIAFGIGFLSFLAPCTLPILPGYFSYLAGVNQDEDKRRRRIKIFFTSLVFVWGFLSVLVILGASASFAGQFLLKNRKFWQKIGGLIIIVFGLQTIGIVRGFRRLSKFTILDRRFLSDPGSAGKGKSFLAGLSFGISWTPCIGPILGSILVLASQSQTLKSGVGLLISYALGLGIPMLFAGFFISQLKFLRHQYIPIVSGITLLILGILLFFDQYSRLTIWTAAAYRFLKIPNLF